MSTPIRCLLVDDEPLALDLLRNHLAQFSQFEVVTTCWNAIQAFEVLKQQEIDLMFLDIHMPGLSGMEFAKTLAHPPAIIFTTAYRDYAVESYELEVVDYLLKPITMERFLKAINRYLDRQEPKAFMPLAAPALPSSSVDPEHLYVSVQRKHLKVVFGEVWYVESRKDYVHIHGPDGVLATKDKISDFEQKLPGYFLRVHRSFIVNTRQITGFSAQDVEIGTHQIPIGVSYRQAVMAVLQA